MWRKRWAVVAYGIQPDEWMTPTVLPQHARTFYTRRGAILEKLRQERLTRELNRITAMHTGGWELIPMTVYVVRPIGHPDIQRGWRLLQG